MKSVAGKKDGVAGKPRYDGATIDTIAEPDEPFLLHESTKDTQNLILAANVKELARQEYIFAGPSGDSSLDLFPQCLSPAHVLLPCKNPTIHCSGKCSDHRSKQVSIQPKRYIAPHPYNRQQVIDKW
jgi:hypothetical protein